MKIAQNSNFDVTLIAVTASENLARRLSETVDYTQSEISKVSNLSRPLVPVGATLSEMQIEELRALAALSRCELKAVQNISSHRAIVGPVIVAIKRLLWPFLRAQLKGTFQAQQEFNMRLLYSLAYAMAGRSTITAKK